MYNIIITSDVLAEGVNLHRANVIVNYDSPWNATRLMQRIGRVNRIGSVADRIYNYMFYPSTQGNREIHLYSNSLIKLQGFHSAFGEDAQIYSREEIVKEFQMFNPNIKDSVDRSLKLLEEVRQLYRNNRKLYNRIKALPVKSRTVRHIDNCTELKARELAVTVEPHSTLVYLSSPRKVEYSFVGADGTITPLAFLDAMDLMRAAIDEQPGNLAEVLECHYQQVAKALKAYGKAINIDFNNHSMAIMKRDKSTQDVLQIMRGMKRMLNNCGNERVMDECDKLMKIVDLGVFTGLRTAINSFHRSIKKQQMPTAETIAAIIARISELYERYNIPIDSVDNSDAEPIEPQIIVSETFI